MNVNYTRIIEKLYSEVKALKNKGELANYIPELADVDEHQFGVHLSTNAGDSYGIGDDKVKFSIQSISKVLSITLAYWLKGEKIWTRLGVEPSGTPFNSLMQLEADMGIPRNPFINAGALVVCDILISNLKDTEREFLAFVRDLSGEMDLDYNEEVANSEKKVGFRNIALCNFLKSFGNVNNDPEELLDFYFKICSIEMNCKTLTKTFSFLANEGRKLEDNKKILSKSETKRINALMQTCGFYDESGEFAFKVGLPGKSGVGGGIIAVYPGQYSIAVWSPKLNEKGNSYKGVRFLEAFTSATEFSIF